MLSEQANSSLATHRDDDDRLSIHWACSYNRLEILEILVSRKDFDPDVQDGSGWTPLMIASSLPEGDGLVDLLLRKEADVNCKSMPSASAFGTPIDTDLLRLRWTDSSSFCCIQEQPGDRS